MPVGVVTSRTRGLYERPPEDDFVLNLDCDSAVGLVAFWPLFGETKGRELDYSRRRNFPLTRTGTVGRGPVPDGGFGWSNTGSGSNYLQTVATPPVTGYPLTVNFFFLPRTSGEYGAESSCVHFGNSAGSNYWVLIYDGANGEGAGAHKVVVDSSGGGQNIQGSTGSLGAAGNVAMATASYASTTSHTTYLNAVGTLSTATVTTPSGWDRYTVGAYRDGGGTFNALNGLLWWVTVHNVARSAAQVARAYDGKYRYELAYPLGRRSYSFAPPTAIAFDAASNSGVQTAQSTYTWNHTCTGSNRFLAVDVSLLSAGATVTGITYNGVALTAIPNAQRSSVTSFGRVECWGLANPASGTNVISVTLSGSITSVGTAASYTNVHQTSPTEAGNSNQATNAGSATDATVDVTSVADQDWIHAALATDDAAVTASQTSRNNVSGGAANSGANEDFGPQAAGTKTMGWTGLGIVSTWVVAGYAIRPVTAASLSVVLWRLKPNPQSQTVWELYP